jgi:chemotaxis protein MotB
MTTPSRRGRSTANIWPGFVDALATLLMVIIFLLMLFVVAQFYLADLLSGKDEALERLNREVAQLSDLLALEELANQDLQATVASLSGELQSTLSERDRLAIQVRSLRDLTDTMTGRLANLQDKADSSEAERSRLAAALAATEAVLARREAALDAAETNLAAREATLEETLAALALSQAKLDTSQTDIADREAKLAAALAALAASQANLDSSQDNLSDREAKLAAALAALAANQADLEKSKATLSDREIQLAAAEAALAKMQKNLDERIAALEEASKQVLLTDAALKQSERAYADSAAELARRMKELEEANKTIDTDAATIEIQLRKLAELEQDIVAMEAYRVQLEEELKTLMVKTKAGEVDLARERNISMAAKAQMAMLNRQLSELRAQIAALNEALNASEAKDKDQKAQIADLGKRLNAALAAKVQELARYRSEFFGRLRDVLGDRKDIRIVGDRFVFQSELLFASAEAELGQTGREQMATLARTLRDISKSIPSEINWVLRVDGHTDRDPIHTAQFPSNWELSTARAISVVRFLQSQGIPPGRLAATGFGEYHPLDKGSSPEAFHRNRRIELKFDQR